MLQIIIKIMPMCRRKSQIPQYFYFVMQMLLLQDQDKKVRSLLYYNFQHKMNRSNVTSVSFTVEDDLISQSSLNSTHKTAFHGLKPFAKQFGLNSQPFDDRPLPNKYNKQIIQRAQMDAYRQMGQHLFNPFQHKLGNGFIPKESDLYQKEKMRQIELLKKQEQDMMNSKSNYTIVFHNEKKSKHNLQMAGKNIVSDGDAPCIGDYFKAKFPNKMEHIQQQEEDNDYEKPSSSKKVNNFISSSKKTEKSIEPVTNIPKTLAKTKQKNQSIPAKNNDQRVSIKSIPQNQNPNKKQVSKKQVQINQLNQNRILSSTQSAKRSSKNQIEQTDQSKMKKIQNQQKKDHNHVKKQKNVPSSKPGFNLNTSTKNNEIPKKQEPTKKASKKPQVPKFNNKILGDKKKKYSDVYEGPDRNLVQQLERELTECPTIGFDDIAQLQVAKNLLQEAVLLPRLMPQFFQGIRKAMKGILLFGPPGTGKTLLAKAVAKDNVFFNVSASSLASKWKGESQKMVRILFQMAKYYSPSVIFFDEIDCIGSKRSQNQHQSARKVKTELLVQMDGVGSTDSQVFVLAATNRPWDLDQALRRRLEKRIYIPLPGAEGRKKMFEINLKGLKVSEKLNWEKLVDITKGCSGADICNVCRDAAYMPMRRKLTQIGGIQKLQQIKQNQLIDEQILQSDLTEAAKKVKPSVGKDDLKRYQAWMAQFGSS